MSRRAAAFTQADVARAIRAARQAGATEVEIRAGDKTVILVRLTAPAASPEAADTPLESQEEIVV